MQTPDVSEIGPVGPDRTRCFNTSAQRSNLLGQPPLVIEVAASS
jgi:hypothetical protein